MVYSRIAAVLMFGLMVAGCQGHDEGTVETDFVVRDKFGQPMTTFTLGEEIRFDLTVTNNSDSEIPYTYLWQGHDITVLRGTTLIWSKFDNSLGSPTKSGTLAAHEVLELGATWNGTDYAGNPVAPGEYEVFAGAGFYIHGEELLPSPEPVTIEIR